MTKPDRPVLVRRRKVLLDTQDEDGGGSWKIAYADFTTAMMALFIVLWLTSITSEEQRDKLAEFFNPISVSRSHSGSDAVLNGRTIDTEGALDKAAQETKASAQQNGGAPDADRQPGWLPGDAPGASQLAERLAQALRQNASLAGLADQVRMAVDGDRLSVSILDSPSVSMFQVGSADLAPEAETLIGTIAETLMAGSGMIRIEGHTDGRTFPRGARYSNWELSGDRANTARRALERAGFPAERIDRVEGYADRMLLNPEDPLQDQNRRVVIHLYGPKGAARPSLLPD